MTGLFSSEVKPVVVGANHRSSSLTLRDRLFVEEDDLPTVLQSLKEAGLPQAVVLSTCDRVEIHAVHENPDTARDMIMEAFARRADIGKGDLHGQVYSFDSDEAVKHIFKVASSLDSLMVGEPQVVGQVKDAHRIASAHGFVGSELDRIFQAAYSAAKRVRTETAVGERPVSIASVAVQLAKDLHGDLHKCSGLLIGAGDMGELTAQSLMEAGLNSFTTTHPFAGRARMVAKNLSCHIGEYEDRDKLAVDADIIITAMNKRTRSVTADMVAAALKARRRKPVFLIDTGIPGDIEPTVNKISDAFLYDLHDLERVAMEGRASREVEARKARTILDTEVDSFLKGRAERQAVPTILALREAFEKEREQVLAEAGEDADKATRLLINRLLHAPSEEIRDLASHQDSSEAKSRWTDTESLLSRLFRLGRKGKD